MLQKTIKQRKGEVNTTKGKGRGRVSGESFTDKMTLKERPEEINRASHRDGSKQSDGRQREYKVLREDCLICWRNSVSGVD